MCRSIRIGLLAVLLAACASTPTPPGPTPPLARVPLVFPTLMPTALPPEPSVTSQGEPAAEALDSGWIAGTSGVELRRVRLPLTNGLVAQMSVVRLDLAHVRLRVGYMPDQPRPLAFWFDEPRTLLSTNGGFFTQDYQPTALVVSDGVVHGTSYDGFGGMLAVAPDGSVSIRPLRDQPYDPAEPLAQALQSFPMLVYPGRQPAEGLDRTDRARRTAIALDQAGRLLVVVCATSTLTLHELAGWLAASDLGVERALNLDGGASTGLYLRAGSVEEQIEAFDLLPLVLLVEPA